MTSLSDAAARKAGGRVLGIMVSGPRPGPRGLGESVLRLKARAWHLVVTLRCIVEQNSQARVMGTGQVVQGVCTGLSAAPSWRSRCPLSTESQVDLIPDSRPYYVPSGARRTGYWPLAIGKGRT